VVFVYFGLVCLIGSLVVDLRSLFVAPKIKAVTFEPKKGSSIKQKTVINNFRPFILAENSAFL
jgi:hypothetical protein